jgi:hypothetical protein
MPRQRCFENTPASSPPTACSHSMRTCWLRLVKWPHRKSEREKRLRGWGSRGVGWGGRVEGAVRGGAGGSAQFVGN